MMDLLTGVVIDYMAAQVRSLETIVIIPNGLQYRLLQAGFFSRCLASLLSAP